MCGIIGVWSKLESFKFSSADFTKMLSELKHRGPDDIQSTSIEANDGLLQYGHTRLSIQDLSPAGRQPMRSKSSRYIVVFNGEIYNHLDLRIELEKDGYIYDWNGHSDTETLLACIEFFGLSSALEKIKGMFAFGLWDSKLSKLFLVKDIAGEKPIYFGVVDGRFVFMSEVNVLNQIPNYYPVINKQALYEYLRLGYVPTPLSIYENISKLEPGTYLEVELVGEKFKTKFTKYFCKENNFLEADTLSDNCTSNVRDRLEEVLSNAVKMQMISDVPVGAFLSGGIDSTLIVALMKRHSNHPVKTFTIGFSESEYNEARDAKLVASYLKTDHTEYYLDPLELEGIIDKMGQIYGEPFSDSSQIPTFVVSKIAREKVSVCLTGDGGDELFGGYNRYKYAEKLWRTISVIPFPIRFFLSKNLMMLQNNLLQIICSKGVRLFNLEKIYPNFGNKFKKILEISQSKSANELYQRLISTWHEPNLILAPQHKSLTKITRSQEISDENMLSDMMQQDFHSYLSDDILVKVDRATMAASLESRAPFLYKDVICFSESLPMKFKIRGNKTKVILREILQKYIPREFVNRPKMGFGVPLGQWLREPLRPWAENLLRPERIIKEGFFDNVVLQKIWLEHKSGKKNWQYQLWNILMFQLWYEKQFKK